MDVRFRSYLNGPGFADVSDKLTWCYFASGTQAWQRVDVNHTKVYLPGRLVRSRAGSEIRTYEHEATEQGIVF